MVQCAKCGLLAIRNPETGEFEEVTSEGRDAGQMQPYGQPPRCLVMAANLPREATELAGATADDNLSRVALAVMTTNRECLAFCQWHPGNSPKEHRKMLFDAEIQKRHEERLQADKERDERRRKEDQDWRAEQERKAASRSYQSLIIGGIIGTLVIAVSQLIAPMMPIWFAPKTDAPAVAPPKNEAPKEK